MTDVKINPNTLCVCGSEKKFKYCCRYKYAATNFRVPQVPVEVVQYFAKKNQELETMKAMGIHINYVRPIVHQGGKMWVLGDCVYKGQIGETFHEFIIGVLGSTLGNEWLQAQFALPESERHYIATSFIKFEEWKAKNISVTEIVINGRAHATSDGWTKTLLALAFDIASLQHTLQLPNSLLERLKGKDSYQGARYEIAIAAIFARLGCKIEFLDDAFPAHLKHCEFIATHNETGVKVAVEAKSRHREGVLNTAGEQDAEKIVKGDVRKLVKNAMKQNPNDVPFMVFVDVNVPIDGAETSFDKKWVQDVMSFMTKQICSQEDPSPHNGVFFTNYSFHYQNEDDAVNGENLSVVPQFSRFPLPNPEFSSMLSAALRYYGNIPNLDVDDDLDENGRLRSSPN